MRAFNQNRFPTLPQQAGHVIAAATRAVRAVVAGRRVRVPPEVQAAREAICAECEENLNGRCKKCGCGVRSQLIRKTHLATERCPLNPPKWLKCEI